MRRERRCSAPQCDREQRGSAPAGATVIRYVCTNPQMEQADDSAAAGTRPARDPRAAPGASRTGARPELSIGDVAAETGVGESTLRMWEARYSFPTPKRLPSGHRRYSEQDLARIQAVLRARDEGLPLPFAINRARRLEAEPRPSIYGA